MSQYPYEENVKKRGRIYNNEVIQVKHQGGFLPNGYGDRFIARRKNKNTKRVSSNSSNLNCSGYKINYKMALKQVFGMNNNEQRSIPLTDPLVPRPWFLNNPENPQAPQHFYFTPDKMFLVHSNKYEDLDWICKPRMKPLIDVDSSHEFEGFQGGGNSPLSWGSLIEWTWTGHIVVFCDDAILFWNPNEDIITKYDIRNVMTLAYNPCYSLLATSNKIKQEFTLNVWSFDHLIMGKYFTFKCGRTPITSICWHKNGIFLVGGTDEGTLLTLDISTDGKKVMHKSSCTQSIIKEVKFSASNTYLASLDVNGKLVIWYWNAGFLKLMNSWESQCATPVSIDWHPWNDYDIAICIKRGTLILIQNIRNGEIETFSSKNTPDYHNPIISFNKVTAELVVNSMRDVNCNNVLVLGAINRVVDQIQNTGVICTKFMWSPNGDQLAFIAGNDIQIYNFFGTKKLSNNSTNLLNFQQNQSIFIDYDSVK